ncbi:hypothetical protein BKA70DRAFT_1229206 [Coprinopsis sp. MPI-PUGE-AT-0042]|nr:hypothetical protein BKA70DRAFT_1229206 [Coprinopsis sp. MPI-PUGE-AT-0042]
MIGAPLFIMEKTMKHLLKQTGGTFRSQLPYRQIFAMILESALPFTLVGVVTAICIGAMDTKHGAYRRAVHIFPFLMVFWTNALSLGPQLIIFRVISGATWTSNPTTHRTRPISQPILFEDDPVVSLLMADANEDYKLEPQELLERRESLSYVLYLDSEKNERLKGGQAMSRTWDGDAMEEELAKPRENGVIEEEWDVSRAGIDKMGDYPKGRIAHVNFNPAFLHSGLEYRKRSQKSNPFILSQPPGVDFLTNSPSPGGTVTEEREWEF